MLVAGSQIKKHITYIAQVDPLNMLVRVECPMCKRSTELAVEPDEFRAWLNGKLIQEAMAGKPKEQREQLISGTCPECFRGLCERMSD